MGRWEREAIVDVAFLFPGQGSQEPGMLHDLMPGQDSEAVLREMSDTLGFDVLSLDTARALKSTIGVQLSLLASGVATARHLLSRSICPSVVAGMSVGAFAAAVLADAISLSDATRLVRSRAEQMEGLYQDGYGMAAIIGLSETKISSIIEGVATDSQPVYVSNLNAPRQIAVAGSVLAIEEVMARARALGARKAELLRVSVPSHCPLMETVAHSLAQQLQAMEVRDPRCIYISNIHARAVRTAKGVREDLANNIAHTVRWHEATEVAQQLGTQTYIEMPPGHVLSDLARNNLVGVAAYPVASTNFEWLVAHIQR
jgi:malonate decarboxylase epsilon subunit